MSSTTSGILEMTTLSSMEKSIQRGHKVPGFAKLQGENFVYFIQTCSVMLGRNTKESTVDFDLSKYKVTGQHISRRHARIFFDFEHRHFSLEVIGRTGCSIQGISYPRGGVPVKLISQDLIEIAGIKFYFLLPYRSIVATLLAARDTCSPLPHESSSSSHMCPNYPGHPCTNYCGHTNGESGVKLSTDVPTFNGFVNMLEIQSADKDTDNQQDLLEEEKDVKRRLITLISELCGPGEWMPMEKLHSEVSERFGKNRPHDRVRRYLTQKGVIGSSIEAEARPWCKLLPILMKYPEHFIIAKFTRGQLTSEFVGLEHLVSLENKR